MQNFSFEASRRRAYLVRMEPLAASALRLLKALAGLAGAAARCVAPSQEEQLCWRRDPLSHPALEAMSERELGDLPLQPRRSPCAAC